VREGRRGEFAAFGWNPDDIPDPGERETFERSKLKWDEVREGQHAGMLEWYRNLIRLRRSSASLSDGDLGHVKVEFDETKRWLTMERGPVKVFCNLGSAAVEFRKPERTSLVLASRGDVVVAEGKIMLPPDTLAILSEETV